MTQSICFGRQKTNICIDLQEVPIEGKTLQTSDKKTVKNDNTYNALDCAKAAEKLKGLRVMACDNSRHCELFQAEISNQELENIFNFFSQKIPNTSWDNLFIDIKTSFDFASLYVLTPNNTLLKAGTDKSLWHINEGNNALSERERAVFELSSMVLSLIKFNKKYKVADATRPALDRRETLLTLDTFSLNTFTTLDQSEILSSDDDIIENWKYCNASLSEDVFLSQCINANAIYFSPILGNDNEVSTYATFSDDGITIYAAALDKMSNCTEEFKSIILHECLHWDFETRASLDEPSELMFDAINLAEAKMLKSGLPPKKIDVLLSEFESKLHSTWASLASELRAYTCENVIDDEFVREIMLHIVSKHPATASIYILDWMTKLLKEDNSISIKQRATALGYIDQFRVLAHFEKFFLGLPKEVQLQCIEAANWTYVQLLSNENFSLGNIIHRSLEFYHKAKTE